MSVYDETEAGCEVVIGVGWTPCQSQRRLHARSTPYLLSALFLDVYFSFSQRMPGEVAANFLGRSSLQKQNVSNGLVLARLFGRTMALPLLAAERQASPVCVWAGPRSGATARRPGMASTGHKVKAKRSRRQSR